MPGAANPLTAMFSSSHFLWLLFYTLILTAFGRGIEEQLGGKKFAFLYLASGMVGNLGLMGVGAAEGIALGAMAPLMGIVGALVAIQPGAIVVMSIYPMPAFAAAAFVLVIQYMGKGGVDVFPFLVGMLLGYSMLGGLEKQAEQGGRPPYARQ